MRFKSLDDFVRVIENGFCVQFYGESSVLRKGVLKVLARIVGGGLFLLSLIAKRIWKNKFVSTCDVEALDGFGEEYALPHKAAQKAVGVVEFDVGVGVFEVPAGTLLVEPYSGLEFEVRETTEIEDVNPTARVMALLPGNEYNLTPGTKLEFRDAPLFDVDEIRVGVMYGGVSIDVEIDGIVQKWGETAADYRRRLLHRIQNPPQGGTASDYQRWAESYEGVTNAYVFPNSPNTNSVSVAVADYRSDIMVERAVVNRMLADVEEKDIWPIIADVRVFSVTPVKARFKAVVAPFTESAKNSVLSAIQDFFRRLKPGLSASFSDIEVGVRANATVSVFSLVKIEIKTGGAWSEVSCVQGTVDTENGLAQIFALDCVEFENGET